MSDPTIPTTAEAEAHLEQARSAVEEAQAALDAVTAATDAAKAEQAHLESLDALTQADLLAQENVWRRLRTLDAEYVAATATHAAALAALAEAEREAHLAEMAVAAQLVETKRAAVEKEITRSADKARAALASLHEAALRVESEAAAAGEPPPSRLDLLSVDTTADERMFLSLGTLLTARREAAVAAAELESWRAGIEAELAKREAASAALAAMSPEEQEAHRRKLFDEAVKRRAVVTGSDPARHRGFAIDALRRQVADSRENPYPDGRNPYAPAPVVAVDYDEARDMDAIAERHRDAQVAAQAARDASGFHDPFAHR